MNAGDIQTSAHMTLDGPVATDRLAAALASQARAGLVVLLDGPVGAGKTHLARGIIQNLLAREGRKEDVPSPTFTLVQTYELRGLDVWHADLYRLSNADELIELGLEAAFQSGFCLIEWPDRMGPLPEGQDFIQVTLSHGVDDTTRRAQLTSNSNDLAQLVETAL